MLLDFPPELIQLVLLNCTTPAFLQAAFSCRALYEIASNYRGGLIYHIRRTPGSPLDASSINTSRLFPLLKRRASKQLYGSQFYASCVTFKFGDQIPNIKASSLALYAGDTIISTTCRDPKTVQILQVKEGQIAPFARVGISWNQSGSVEILKTAFDGHDRIYILYRFTPSIEEHDPNADHPFVKQAREISRDGLIHLTYHSLQSPDSPARVTAFPEQRDFEPSALAVGHDGTFAISWYHRMFCDHTVVLYTIRDDSMYNISPNLLGFSYSPRQLQRWHGNTRGPWITDIAFNDRSSQLLYYYQARSLYASFHKINRGFPTLYENASPVRFTDDLSLLFSVAVPFFGTHKTNNVNGLAVCRWRYLSLGIATHRLEKWTVACLLRSEATCRAANCGHILNLERGRRLMEWVVVARLWGFRDSTNSLGCKVATSNEGTRIAVANWNVVYVWALEPGALIDMDPQEYYHSSWRSSSNGIIELQPIVLHLDAVCFQLRFTAQENELVAITDRGIMLWNLSTSGTGSRTSQELAN
ncbi:hypothetical protein BDW59DRAFT_139141 [Aspergillus cavernicola]|uniref:F-box domain-containing protein n=1 Tax=Aspergillus cavernicola TaxID=176166 RepID=A0ABR4J005_9EURO